MKKIVLIIFTVSLNVFLFSCTPEDLEDGIYIDKTEVATAGDDGQTPDEEDDD